jgi:uncharacterized protein DUF5330
MFFLLRMAFWLGLVLVLLPREKTPESAKLPQISTSDAVQAATAAVSDASQFCKRQPAACEVGGQAATVIGARAQEGARKLYQIITDKKSDAEKTDKADKSDRTDRPEKTDNKKSPDHTGSIDSADDADAPADAAPRDTLTPDDLVAEWRVPPAP